MRWIRSMWTGLGELLGWNDPVAGRMFAMGLAPMMSPLPPYPYRYVNPWTGVQGMLGPEPQDNPFVPGIQYEHALADLVDQMDLGRYFAERAWNELLTEPKPWGD